MMKFFLFLWEISGWKSSKFKHFAEKPQLTLSRHHYFDLAGLLLKNEAWLTTKLNSILRWHYTFITTVFWEKIFHVGFCHFVTLSNTEYIFPQLAVIMKLP